MATINTPTGWDDELKSILEWLTNEQKDKLFERMYMQLATIRYFVCFLFGFDKKSSIAPIKIVPSKKFRQ